MTAPVMLARHGATIPPVETDSPLLAAACRAIAAVVPGSALDGDSDAAQLCAQRCAQWAAGPDVATALAAAADHPDDRRLVDVGTALGLEPAELLAVALAAAVDRDPSVGRVLAWLQAPSGGARPTLGLLARALATQVDALAAGAAVHCGLASLTGDGPLPDRALAVPLHLLLALRGIAPRVPGARIANADLPLPWSVIEAARAHADGLASGQTVLAIRSAHPDEAAAAATAVVDALGAAPLLVEDAGIPGLGPWLLASHLVPVWVARLGPGEVLRIPVVAGYRGPALAALGPEGTIAAPAGVTVVGWTLAPPGPEARADLWLGAVDDPALARALAERYRHGPGRIAELARAARHGAASRRRRQVGLDDVERAVCAEDGALAAHAQHVPDRVGDDVLVLTRPVREELELLVARCRVREGLVDGLGVASRTRYRPGVRALFVGPSGGGKTLAAAWLATRLGLPLYRVDLASVVSKYIGETEKNLAELLARAEAAEVVLFFDEADSLFGKRTEVHQASDRYANAQTNYLLQRIETYDGVVVLASNSRGRFDPAFTRRIDQIVEFGLPGPDERRALWLAHLGEAGHHLPHRDVNRLAGACDLAGGHVRNAVLAAAVLAGRGPIGWEHLIGGLRLEYRKLGRPMPHGLA